jgi:hypothetical protein
MDDFALALQHYRLLFPDVASLGTGTPPATWWAEYLRVSQQGLTATLITNLSTEGASHSGVKNFPQKTLLSALHARRGELDTDYSDHLATGSGVQRRPIGIRIQLSE